MAILERTLDAPVLRDTEVLRQITIKEVGDLVVIAEWGTKGFSVTDRQLLAESPELTAALDALFAIALKQREQA